MKNRHQRLLSCIMLAALFSAPALVLAQAGVVILTGAQLTRVVPPGFYYSGQSAPTQLRNSAAARFGKDRHVIAGLVDTSGYSADVRASYEGFLIADAPVTIQGSDLGTGAYGFGFTDDGHLNIFDVGGHSVLTVTTEKDTHLRRPRPLMMQTSTNGVRLYSGRNFVNISVK